MPKPNEGLRISAAEYKQWQNRPTEPLMIYRTAFTISNVLRDRVKQQQRNAVWFEWHEGLESYVQQPYAVVASSPCTSLPMIRMYKYDLTTTKVDGFCRYEYGLSSQGNVTEFSPFRQLRHVSVHGTGRSIMLAVKELHTCLQTECFDAHSPGPEHISACWHLKLKLENLAQ